MKNYKGIINENLECLEDLGLKGKNHLLKVSNIMKNKFPLDIFLNKVKKIYNKFFIESSTTIPKGSTSQANGDGSGNPLTGKAEVRLLPNGRGYFELRKAIRQRIYKFYFIFEILLLVI